MMSGFSSENTGLGARTPGLSADLEVHPLIRLFCYLRYGNATLSCKNALEKLSQPRKLSHLSSAATMTLRDNRKPRS